MLATKSASAARNMTIRESEPICNKEPITIIPLMALVTLINGVCSAGVTFQTTCQPTNMASTKTVKCPMNEGGATTPRPRISPTTLANAIKVGAVDFFGAPSKWAEDSPTLAGGAFGTAERRGGGGGQVILVSFTTVIPRITSSFMSTLIWPSFSGHRSVSRWVTLLP